MVSDSVNNNNITLLLSFRLTYTVDNTLKTTWHEKMALIIIIIIHYRTCLFVAGWKREEERCIVDATVDYLPIVTVATLVIRLEDELNKF